MVYVHDIEGMQRKWSYSGYKKRNYRLDISTTSDWSSSDPSYSMEISPDDRTEGNILLDNHSHA